MQIHRIAILVPLLVGVVAVIMHNHVEYEAHDAIVLILRNCLTETVLFRLQQDLLCVGDFLESGFVNLGIRQIERG